MLEWVSAQNLGKVRISYQNEFDVELSEYVYNRQTQGRNQ